MAGSKRSKIVKQRQTPDSRVAKTTKDPDKYYDEKPAWNFVNADQTNWSFTQENVGGFNMDRNSSIPKISRAYDLERNSFNKQE